MNTRSNPAKHGKCERRNNHNHNNKRRIIKIKQLKIRRELPQNSIARCARKAWERERERKKMKEAGRDWVLEEEEEEEER